MAVRLAVIMIETAPPTALAGRFAADVVGSLIGRPGLDLTLVNSLTATAISETDRLSLEAISGDVAILDWQRPDSMLESLAAIGIHGSRWPHRHDPHAEPKPAAGRRIYIFDLSRFGASMEVVEALENLNRDRKTQTFAIDNLAPAPKKTLPNDSRSPSPSHPPDASVGSDSVSAEQDQSLADGPLPSIDLDDLIDQLDQSDQP